MRTTVGQPYSDDVVEQDIRNLYETGRPKCSDLWRAAGDGVRLSWLCKRARSFAKSKSTARTSFTAETRSQEIKIKMNTPVERRRAGEGAPKNYRSLSGARVQRRHVQYQLDPMDESRGTSRAVFTINEGEKGAVSSVRFEGNHAFQRRTLRKQMKTKGKTLISFMDKSGRLDEAQLQQDLDKRQASGTRTTATSTSRSKMFARNASERTDDDHHRDQGRHAISRRQAHLQRISTDD